jgi:hypothetical protein
MKQMYSPLPVVIVCALLFSYTAQAQCGLSATGTATANANNTNVGTLAWSGTGNTTASDGGYATSSATFALLGSANSNYLTLSGFNFNIPVAYTVCGVGVSIVHNTGTVLSLVTYVADNVVQLATINGTSAPTLIGTNQALMGGANGWPATSATANYGGNGDLMGAVSIPNATVNNANFGVVISAHFAAVLAIVLNANVDKVSMSIYTNPQIVLPIKLENFTVTGGSEGNTIRWTANANDIANVFIVQRSSDGTAWTDLSTLEASTGTESYSYTDANPLAGPNYYRLKLVNTDGTTGYSIVGIISTKTSTPNISFYPNPFHDMINISAPGTFTHLSLRDIAGRTLWVKEYPGGINSTQIPAGDLPQGLYFITVDGKTYKLIKN